MRISLSPLIFQASTPDTALHPIPLQHAPQEGSPVEVTALTSALVRCALDGRPAGLISILGPFQYDNGIMESLWKSGEPTLWADDWPSLTYDALEGTGVSAWGKVLDEA